MPKVYSADIKQLLDRAIERFESESGLKLSNNYPLFFHALAEEINRETKANLKSDTLYKHLFIRLRSFDEASIGYSWVYLDALATFVLGKKYKEVYPILRNSVKDIKAAVKRIDFDILKGSEDDPGRPEFPPKNPAFPATPTLSIEVPGFQNVWLKDESCNPTGTHKDRMAWEIVIYYRNFLAHHALKGRFEKIPQLSLISSGCAAIAIQSQLRYYNLPSLKVIVDKTLEESIKTAMMKIGCEVFEVDLKKEMLNSESILHLTENENGKDLTFGVELDFIRVVYYDWLSYEILNQSPDYCLIPFGSGGLLENLMSINRKEIEQAPNHSKRFFGNIEVLKKCHFIGATTNLPQSKMDKLYSPFSTQTSFNEQLTEFAKLGLCGEQSRVVDVEETFIEEAMKIIEKTNINTEPSGIAGLALLLQMKEQIPDHKKILIINTGKLKMDKFGD